ncbi:hypothetical protein ABI59_04740 [Acidobacteria bacterium Mor1]|nr:hypothetical protein ABI59_04740 [Acidobacteria bacterium Mor1]
MVDTTKAAGSGNASPDQTAHFREYWRVIWNGRYTIAAVFVVVVALAAVKTFLATPVYRAVAVIEVQPKSSSITPGQDVSGLGSAGYGWFAENKYHNTQVEIMRSHDIAERVVDTLGLRSDPFFEAAHNPVQTFRSMIRVDPRRETGLIEVSIEGKDPEQITAWVNEVARAYVERNLEVAQESVSFAVDQLTGQVKIMEQKLIEAEEARREAQSEAGISDLDGSLAIVRDRQSQYSKELTGIEIELGKLDKSLTRLKELQDSGGDPMTLPELASDSELKELNRQRIRVERDIASADVSYRPGHPKYEEKVAELATVDRKIAARIDEVVSGLRSEYGLKRDQERYLRGQLRSVQDRSEQLGEATSRLETKRIESETRKQVFDSMSKVTNQISLAAGLLTNNVRVLDEAIIPDTPIRPRKKVALMIGGLVGMFLGIGLVFFLDYLDNTFRTPKDIEQHLGLSVLSVIPKHSEKKLASGVIKEAYQSLRTSLIFSSKNRTRKVVLVTSSGPQEGKSTTISRLGRALATGGEKVVIIDCDLRRPTQQVHNEVPRSPGLTNFLAAPESDKDWRPFAKETDTATLQIIPAGPTPPSPPDMLTSDRFLWLVNELQKEYDWVLIDSPPAAALSDAPLLATLAHMVVMVVRHNHTDRDVAIRAMTQVKNVNEHLIGAVLNNVDIDKSFSKDLYYTGYYYYSSDDGERKKKRKKSDKDLKVGAGA